MSYINQDRFIDHCAVFGTYNIKDAVYSNILGLHALQHRGQRLLEYFIFKIMASFHSKKALAKSLKFMRDLTMNKLKILKLQMVIIDYSTFGGSEEKNIQPLYAQINKDIIPYPIMAISLMPII